MTSGSQASSPVEQKQAQEKQDDTGNQDDAIGHRKADIGHTQHAVAKAIDHVQDRVDSRYLLPEFRQQAIE